MGFKKIDNKIIECRDSRLEFLKLNLKDVAEIIDYGYLYKIYYCASNQEPDKNKYFRTNRWMADKCTADFKRWHKDIKKQLCNADDGKTLKYYIDVNEQQ